MTGGAFLREPNCFACGRTRSRCIEQRIFEERRGVPDPHDFETFEDAERRSTRKQLKAEGAA